VCDFHSLFSSELVSRLISVQRVLKRSLQVASSFKRIIETLIKYAYVMMFLKYELNIVFKADIQGTV